MNNVNWNRPTQDQPRMQPWQLSQPAQEWHVVPSGLENLAAGFAPISLKEMDSVALLNRTDTKFVMTISQLLQALAAIQADYRILSVGGQRLNHYRTLYFDTAGFELYNLHVNGRADRYKVRSREYTDSCLSFLEVKHKTSKGRTVKDRIRTDQPVTRMTAESQGWLNDVLPYDSRQLLPRLWNTFTRITLVNKHSCERVTIDLDLTFYTADKMTQLSSVVIAEVKMDSLHQNSPFLAQMRTQHIHERGFSKYCIGVSMLYEQVKKNTLKPMLLWIERMNGGSK